MKLTDLFGIKLPIIQAGMVYVSGAKLAAAASNAGILGLIGAGSMTPELLKEHIQKAFHLTDKPFGVNIPLLYKEAKAQIDVALEQGIKIFFTSAGNPKTYTTYLKEKGCLVVHVTGSPHLAKKCEQAGVDAIVAEGFEAGGHNCPDELTTMTLIPQVRKAISIPLIAAGGIANGTQMAAAFCLGADGVQIGSRFAVTKESSAHTNYKKAIVAAQPDATMLVLKKLTPVRMLKNNFYKQIKSLEEQGADPEQLKELLGKSRARAGILEGDTDQGELEVGQVSGMIEDIPSVAQVVTKILKEYEQTLKEIKSLS